MLRDTHPAFEYIKEHGSIGIPCFVFEDGSIQFSMGEIEKEEYSGNATCSLDGTGC
jgi:glutaredoxin-related protein